MMHAAWQPSHVSPARIMLTCLKEGYLILISFDAKGEITTKFVAEWADKRDARETFLA
jgi:hypothetical protein